MCWEGRNGEAEAVLVVYVDNVLEKNQGYGGGYLTNAHECLHQIHGICYVQHGAPNLRNSAANQLKVICVDSIAGKSSVKKTS